MATKSLQDPFSEAFIFYITTKRLEITNFVNTNKEATPSQTIKQLVFKHIKYTRDI